MFYFNNFKFFAFRLAGGDVTVFFYSEKKVTKKTPLSGFAPKNPLEGVAVRLAGAYFFCTASIVLSEGTALVTPKCGVRAPKDWLVYSFIRLNISCEMCPAKQPSTVVVWLACCFFGIGVWLYTSWRPL